ncbi:MAG TPA: ferrochelatase [Acidimicrobiales bacterium]|nr:ferrochelatase [Acidimicrobiales bacterium]
MTAPGNHSRPTGVLVMAYGTPAGPDQVEAYYTHVRGGRPPSPELLADLQARYRAIGGSSPLAERTQAQARALGLALDQARPGAFRVAVGTKHAPPFIEDGVAALADAGVGRTVALVLAPHYSALSVGGYLERAREAARRHRIDLIEVRSWHLAPGLLEALSGRLSVAIEGLAPAVRQHAEVLVTAHSLPTRILDLDDPYPDQLRATAEAVCALAGVRRWRLAWQSAGRTPEPWLGPDVVEVIRRLPEEGAAAVVVCPAGFTSDHLEILYDLDIEARRAAEEAGLTLVRTASLNDDPTFVATLAQVVIDATDGVR